MMLIELDAAVVLDGIPLPTVCMLQAVIMAVTIAVAAISEMSRIVLSCRGDGVEAILNAVRAVCSENARRRCALWHRCTSRRPEPLFTCDHKARASAMIRPRQWPRTFIRPANAGMGARRVR